MGDTNKKGDIGLAQAIAAFTRSGFNVSIPISESLGYDLIVEQDTTLYKVQVKFSLMGRSGISMNDDYKWGSS